VRAVIVGAGIGGLTAALALAARGIEPTVLEQATALGDVGAGIQLAPNATRVLQRVGVYESLRPLAVFPVDLTFRRWSDGAVIARRELGPALERSLGAPYIQVHRADLHSALVGGLPAGCAVQLATRVVGVEQDGVSATAVCADGRRVRGDVLIAADGIHSAVRAAVFGQDRPEYSGTVSYRAVVPAERLAGLDFPDNASWLGPEKHFVHYWVRGGRLLNVVTGVRAGQAQESWTAQVDPAEGLRVFAGWDARVVGILERVETLYRRGIFTRAPLRTWAESRVALLGDSAHAMVPFHAQGAAQSVVDAAVLARCLADIESPAEALGTYAELRVAKANEVQQRSSNQGRLYHLPDGPESEARNLSMAAVAEAQPFGALLDLWAEDAFAD
jgi:salicylate hydroxylase